MQTITINQLIDLSQKHNINYSFYLIDYSNTISETVLYQRFHFNKVQFLSELKLFKYFDSSIIYVYLPNEKMNFKLYLNDNSNKYYFQSRKRK